MLRRWLSTLLAPAPVAPAPASDATEIDRAMMTRAVELARAAAALGEVPVGAVVYHPADGVIVAEAHNRREIDANPTAHAELLAIAAAAAKIGDWRLNHLALAVTLEPCCMCAGTIVNARLGRVVYGARDPKAGFCGSLASLTQDRRLNHRVTPIEGVMADECSRMLKEFFRSRR
jgi:tRNA(Arg) A34 adenosine deaminase TadA